MVHSKLKAFLYSVTIAGLVFLSGCGEEIATTTRLLPGGGIEREISLENAKPGAPADWGPIPVDAAWVGSTAPGRKPDTAGGEPLYVHKLSRRYASTREMRAALSGYPAGGSMLVPEISWTKKWRGFYKVYSFREFYPVLSVFRNIPAREFFSPEEFDLLLKAMEDEKAARLGHSEGEMDALGDKYLGWMSRCVAEDLVRALVREADETGDSHGSKWLREDRESVVTAMLKALDVDHNPELGAGPFLAKVDEILRTGYFRGLLDRKSPALASWEKRRRFVDVHLIDTFPFRLIVPGLMTATNARDVEGNTASWKLDIIKLTLSDFEMTAESRAVNWTAVGLAGLGLFIFMALIVRAAWTLRRRSRPNAGN